MLSTVLKMAVYATNQRIIFLDINRVHDNIYNLIATGGDIMKTKMSISIVLFIITSVFLSVFVVWPLVDVIKLEFSIGIIIAIPFGILVITPLWIFSLVTFIMAINKAKKVEKL